MRIYFLIVKISSNTNKRELVCQLTITSAFKFIRHIITIFEYFIYALQLEKKQLCACLVYNPNPYKLGNTRPLKLQVVSYAIQKELRKSKDA